MLCFMGSHSLRATRAPSDDMDSPWSQHHIYCFAFLQLDFMGAHNHWRLAGDLLLTALRAKDCGTMLHSELLEIHKPTCCLLLSVVTWVGLLFSINISWLGISDCRTAIEGMLERLLIFISLHTYISLWLWNILVAGPRRMAWNRQRTDSHSEAPAHQSRSTDWGVRHCTAVVKTSSKNYSWRDRLEI